MKAQRIRIHFSKTEAMRFTGHLDLRLTWERTFRRSGLPLAYSEGYTPKPQFNFALPLPLGFISSAELGDFWLSNAISIPIIKPSLVNALPPGLAIHNLQEIPDLYAEKLPTLVRSASYAVRLPDPPHDIPERISALLSSPALIRKRRGKSYDLRPLILGLRLMQISENCPSELTLELLAKPGETGRPDEVLKALDIDPLAHLICRTKITLGGREE